MMQQMREHTMLPILSRGMKSRQWELTVRNTVRTMLLEEFNSTSTRTWVTSAQGMS